MQAELAISGPFAVLQRVRSTIIIDLRLDGASQRDHLRRTDDIERALNVMSEYGAARPARRGWCASTRLVR